VPPEWEGLRLDRALVDLCPEVSRTRLQSWIRGGTVRLDGQIVTRASLPLVAGQELLFEPFVPGVSPGLPGPRFNVLHDEPGFAVIDKPPGQVAHRNAGVGEGTVADQAAELWGALPNVQGVDRPGIVHRLDGATSGVMLVAKTEPYAVELRRQFKEREVRKTYRALVHGVPRFDSDWIDRPLGRNPRSPDRFAVVEADQGRPAETFYRVVERFARHTLVECEPRTGRTHQIRVHLEWLGHPIVGDKLYTGAKPLPPIPEAARAPRRQALHALRLAFQHPEQQREVQFEAPFAADLQPFLDWLRAQGR
jgi:23S rRNA pseudouridine1911/1915/1917 synthase